MSAQRQIVLMRHGKPKINQQIRLSAADFGAWVNDYNTAGIDPAHAPPQDAVEQARHCAATVCSHLPRSLESAKTLGVERVALSDAAFREMDMPHAGWHFPRLPLAIWLLLFRLAWVLGYSGQVESFKAAKLRARRCAERLADLATTHGAVLFVGHGSVNWFIGKELQRMGWICAGNRPRKYWEFTIYSSQAA